MKPKAIRCPFCGEDKTEVMISRNLRDKTFKNAMYVKCFTCEAIGPKVYSSRNITKEEMPFYEERAILLWNDRARFVEEE